MNKKVKRVLQGILFVLIIAAFIYIGQKDFSEKTTIDNERFDLEYKNVDKDNVFVYATANEIYSVLKNGTGIIFMGFPSNKWSGYYANVLNNAAKEVGVKKILYYDFKEDRDTKNAIYQSIVLKLANYVPVLDTGVQNIYAPTLVIVKNGQIMAYDAETSINLGNKNPATYWTNERVSTKLQSFRLLFQTYLSY